MSDHVTHDQHSRLHGSGCGHIAVKHEGNVDYSHGGRLHNVHAGQVDEHALAEGGSNPSACTPSHTYVAHDGKHTHGVAIWTI
jgi:hypothetical protein